MKSKYVYCDVGGKFVCFLYERDLVKGLKIIWRDYIYSEVIIGLFIASHLWQKTRFGEICQYYLNHTGRGDIARIAGAGTASIVVLK